MMETASVSINGRDYFVTSNGNIYRILPKGLKELSKYIRKGYEYVSVCNNGERKKYSVHRIICSAFNENPNGYPDVNHIDGNTLNNNASNLEWVSPRGNQLHSRYTLGNQTGFHDTPVICIDTGETFVSTRDAWRKTGVNYCHICECAKCKRKTAGGMRWMYAALG